MDPNEGLAIADEVTPTPSRNRPDPRLQRDSRIAEAVRLIVQGRIDEAVVILEEFRSETP